MKSPVRTLYKRVGKSYRLMTEIKCSVCGARTYADGPKKIEDYCSRTCNVCDTLDTAERRGVLDIVFSREKDKEIKKRLSDGSDRTVIHGLAHTKLYKRWLNMLSRCYDQNSPNYPDYGGRGITVCDEWFDFSTFFWHLGEVPDGMELDRVDNDYIYCPENVRWVTREANNTNRRNYSRGRCRKTHGWWLDLGLKNNPYVYGPMPWKRTSLVHRRQEAIERGWYRPKKDNPGYLDEF